MSLEISMPSTAADTVAGVDFDAYNRFVDKSPQGILYCHTWWLDAVAPGRFEILTVQKNDTIQAAWPLVWPENGDQSRVVMPTLTQKLGILCAPNEGKYAERLSKEHRLIEELIGQLPPETRVDQKFHENFTNWLPFYWNGYQQTTRYTYILENLTDAGRIWAQMRNTMRTQIRKAQKRGVRVRDTDDLEYFWAINAKTFRRQGIEIGGLPEFLERIDEACLNNAGRRILIAEDTAGRAHGCVYLVHDENCAVYLMAGGDEEVRASGAGPLVAWESIQFAATVSKRFDFEGSMIRPIEHFYRGFGAKQVPYFRISGRPTPKEPKRLTSERRGLTQRALNKIAGALDLGGRALRKMGRIIEPG